MKKYFFILSTVALVLTACGGGSKSGDVSNDSTNVAATTENVTQDYDLSANGIPVVVNAPSGAEIKKGMGNMEMEGIKAVNYVVDKGAFKLDISYTTGSEYTLEEMMTDAKSLASEEEGFVEIVSEESNGFIYKKNGEYGEDYNFYYVNFKDANPIEFGSGLNMENYTLDQIKVLFDAAKAAKTI